MKKRNYAILIICAAIVVCAAFLFGDSPQTSKESTNSISDPGCINLAGGVHIYDIEEYNNFVATTPDLPSNFVTAEMLRSFGEFDGFICNSDYTKSYAYCLTLDNDDFITIGVSHVLSGDSEYYKSIVPSKAGDTMMNLSSDESGILEQNGIQYTYVNGTLISISWVTNNVSFTITITGAYDSIATLSTDSLLHQMLSTSTSDQIAVSNALSTVFFDDQPVTE